MSARPNYFRIGVFVAGGWAQDLYGRLTGSSSTSSPPASASATSPAASGVLLGTVTKVVAVDPPPVIVSQGDGVKVSSFLGDETRRVYGLGPPPKHLSLIWKTSIGGGLTATTALAHASAACRISTGCRAVRPVPSLI